MELEYFFRGIKLADNGTYPRAVVDVKQPDDDLAEGMAVALVTITLPLRTLDGELRAIELQALQTARQLVHAPALAAWLQAQVDAGPG